MAIIQNAIRIIDQDTILISRNVHDYQEHDGYFVDGGNDYQRYGYPNGKQNNVENLLIHDTDDFHIIKRKMIWGTYGKDGKQPLRFIRLIDANTEHLEAILKIILVSELRKEIIKSIIFDRKLIERRNKIKRIVKCT